MLQRKRCANFNRGIFWKRRIETCMKKKQSSRMQMDGARKIPLRFCARCTNGTVAPFQRPRRSLQTGDDREICLAPQR
jgi:hypothetical protein